MVITVFGSLNADLVFPVDALPRPGETVLTQSFAFFPGGKGANQAAAAARAGGRVRLFGRVGDDDHGRRVLAAQREAGVDVSGVRLGTRPTGVAAISVDRRGENQIVVASGANGEALAGDLAEDAIGPGTILVATMELPRAETEAAIRRAHAAGGRVLLNLAPAGALDPAVLRAVDWLVVNEVEAAMVAAPLGVTGLPPPAVAAALVRAHGGACIVTLGSAGAIAVTEAAAWTVEALPVVAVDTTGAGDAFVGVLAAGLDAGMPLPAAMHRAVAAASLSCTAPGAQSALPDATAIAAAVGRLAPARFMCPRPA